MGPQENPTRAGSIWCVAVVLTLLASTFLIPHLRNLAHRFFDSLRLPARPRINVGLNAAAGPNGNRSLEELLGDMISNAAPVTINEAGQFAATPQITDSSPVSRFVYAKFGLLYAAVAPL
jgi:hypothetical protein